MMKRYIGIITNYKKDTYYTFTKQIVEYLKSFDINIVADKKYLDNDKIFYEFNDENIKKIEFLIVIGGDGTILRTISNTVNYNKPILGINFGTVGFLANVEKPNWQECIDKALKGDYTIDKRMLLDVYDNNNNFLGNALNDTVLFRHNHYGVAEYKVYINDEAWADYLADGVIISAPTGSTAYNLSSGGPIVSPNCDLMIVTPVCPHTLNNTSIIVNSNDKIRVQFNPKITTIHVDDKILDLTFDEILIKKSEKKASFIRFADYNFYSLLVKKIRNPILKGDE